MRDYASELPVYLDMDLREARWSGVTFPYLGFNSRHAAMSHLKASIVKKFANDATPKADQAALVKFLEINEKCRGYVRTDQRDLPDQYRVALGEAKSWIHRLVFPSGDTGDCIVTLGSIADGFGLGSGANIGVKGTSFLSKLGLSDLSATDPSLHLLYRRTIARLPTWSDVEFIRSSNRETSVVRGSRLSFVPKTRDISRTICTEPVLNMLFQKGIGDALERGLRKASGISLEDQPDRNRRLCRAGSETGRFGTIDLSSASDSMSTTMVREFFPRQLVWWLERTRSPVTTLPSGEVVELQMVSSMGNAFTFPLQTIFFCSVVYGAYRALGIPFTRSFKHSLGNFAVFGDDIIVDYRAYDLVVALLSVCGFSVNVDKSFNTSDFRESCGHDYFQGHNIRGVYIKRLLDDGDLYSAINRLNRWSARFNVPLPHTVGYLRRGLRTLYVPFDESDDAGIKAPSVLIRNKLRSLSPGVYKYRKLVLQRGKEYDVSDVEVRPPRMEGWFNNHSAVLLAAVAGTLRDCKVVDRLHHRSFRVKQAWSPRWDFIPAEDRASGSFVHGWESLYEVNLNLLG